MNQNCQIWAWNLASLMSISINVPMQSLQTILKYLYFEFTKWYPNNSSSMTYEIHLWVLNKTWRSLQSNAMVIKCGSLRIREENNTPINGGILIHFGLSWCSMKNVSKLTAPLHQISFYTQSKPLKITHCARCICFIFGHSFFITDLGMATTSHRNSASTVMPHSSSTQINEKRNPVLSCAHTVTY